MIFDQLHMGKMSRKMAFFEKLASIPQSPMKVVIYEDPKVSASSKGLRIARELHCFLNSTLIGV
jgi:hypothetical protein